MARENQTELRDPTTTVYCTHKRITIHKLDKLNLTNEIKGGTDVPK